MTTISEEGPGSAGVTLGPRPQPGLLRPFSFVIAVVVGTALLPPYSEVDPVALVLAFAFLGMSFILFRVSFREGERSWRDAVAVYLFFPFVAFFREGVPGTSTWVTALVLLPLFWLALTGTRRELWIAGALAGATFLVPVILQPDRYPVSDWKRSIFWMAIAVFIAPLVQNLVQHLARETRAAREARVQADTAALSSRLANERALRLFEDAPHGVAALDTSGRITRGNGALREILGVSRDEMTGRSLVDFADPGDETIRHHLDRMLAGGQVAAIDDSVIVCHQGNEKHVSLSSRYLRHANSDEDFIITHVVDDSERRRYERQLAYLASHDPLTGLANRRQFEESLDRHVQRLDGDGLRGPGGPGGADRRGSQGPTGAILLLDLDHFKQVNDTLGHGAGDQLLITIAGLLRAERRQSDVVARLGGDEFALLLPDADEAGATAVARSITERIAEFAATLDGVRRRVTASVGVVTFRAAREHDSDILALADMTMYDAKEAGRHRLSVLHEGSEQAPKAVSRLQWQNRIEDALDNDDYVLHLQPILDLHTGRIASAEALVRLADSDELVSPARFLYIAERSGLAPRLDAWVVRRAIAMLADLRRLQPDFTLEVNLSGHSIGNPDIEEAITMALAEHSVDPSALVLEITETAAVSDVTVARAFAERMTRLGCKFALDDFGAGFGSFYYLKHLLFDYVKIDGEFVANVHRSDVDRTITRSIVGIARDLGKRTIAEFVASEEVLRVVRDVGVDLAQGYFVGAPVDFDEFVATHLTPAPAPNSPVAAHLLTQPFLQPRTEEV